MPRRKRIAIRGMSASSSRRLPRLSPHLTRWSLWAGLALTGWAQAEPASPVADLAAENHELRQRVEALEEQVAELRRQLAGWRAERPAAMDAPAPAPAPPPRPPPAPRRSLVEQVVISGELAVTYFDGGRESAYPSGQFTLDDAKLYLEAEIRRGIYAFAEIDVVLREGNEQFRLGEFYLEVEDVGAAAGWPDLGTLRLGRLDVPFGEEYQVRSPLDNPLISHSLADFWGVDEGIELFGGRGDWTYLLAVQNGSRPANADFTTDKAVTLRLGYAATPRLHLGLSAMRTGDIDPGEERLTELWWGGGFLRSIGSPATTRFGAKLLQLDAAYRWRGGHLKAAGGWVWYDDNDPAGDHARTMTHVMLEGVQDLGRDVFAAARYSRIETDGGYPIAGHGDFGKYFFGPFLTEEVWRLSLGLGYRFTPDFLFKFEYTFERGTFTSGLDRTDLDQLAAQAAVRF